MAKRNRGAGRRGGGLERLSTSALAAELARRQRGLPGFEAKRNRLERQLADLNARIEGLGGSRSATRKRPKNTMTLVPALAKVLKGRTMGVTEVAAAVRKAGYKTNSHTFRTIVNQALIKHKDVFKKLSRGKYTAA